MIIRKGLLLNGKCWNYLCITFVLIIMSGCFLDRPTGSHQWETNVSPTLICPGDQVDVSWNLGAGGCLGAGCPPAPTVDIRSMPDLFTSNPIPTHETFGSRAVFPTEDTDFTFDATVAGNAAASYGYDVTLILPERETTVPGKFPGVCLPNNRGPSWSVLSYDVIPSDRVTITRICNTSNFRISFIVDFGGHTEPEELRSGECTTPDYSDVVVSVRNARAMTLTQLGDCSPNEETASPVPPPDLSVDVTVACRPG